MLVWKISSPWMAMLAVGVDQAADHVVAQIVPAGRGGTPRSGRRSPASMAWMVSCGFGMNITPPRTSGVPCWRP